MMIHSIEQSVWVFGIICLTTIFTRALPFIVFPDHKETPKYISYLGSVLPFTIIGMLVVYCLKDISFRVSPFGIPELIAVVAIVIFHWWKNNTLLSIGGGTLIYMLLVQGLFR